MSKSGPIARAMWTMTRFGVSPTKLYQRVFTPADAPIICHSIPKAGTHLLERALCLFPGVYRKKIRTVNEWNIDSLGGYTALVTGLKRGQVIMTHLHPDEEMLTLHREKQLKSIFVMRDPRDVLVSESHYAEANWMHPYQEALLQYETIKERLLFLIRGSEKDNVKPVYDRIAPYAKWMDVCHTVKFEELIGAQGMGDDVTQRETLKGIYQAAGLEASEAQVDRFAGKLFSSASPTFRKGSIGNWKNHFDEEISEAFAECAGDIVEQFGYQDV